MAERNKSGLQPAPLFHFLVFMVYLVSLFEAGLHYVVQASLDLSVLLPQPLKYWYHLSVCHTYLSMPRCESSCTIS